jgi:hypothetical protein
MRQQDIGFSEFQRAVNQAALHKSEFYKEVTIQIREAIARQKPKLDKDGKPIFEGQEAVLVENTTDDMIAAIFSIGMRGNRIGKVHDSFINRIERGAYYARILETGGDTNNIARHLKEKTRMDVAIVIKNILPDMTRIQTPIVATSGNAMMASPVFANQGDGMSQEDIWKSQQKQIQ